MIFELGISLATILYCGFTFFLFYHWKKIDVFEGEQNPDEDNQKITVIVPVRNEAENLPLLLQDFENQYFRFFEVIIIDDHSEDNTISEIEQFRQKSTLEIRVLSLPSERKIPSHKKAAITLGISNSLGEIIVTTDGDCRVGPNWLRHIHNSFASQKAVFLSSGVTFLPEKSLFEKFQTIEFMSLVGSGAACMQAGIPNMCNGANLAYRKEVFKEVKGFAGVEHIPSGDDEFLMHKISEKFPKGVRFLKDDQTTVTTAAKPDFWSFFQQRKRWGGKWSYYQARSPKLVALGIFSYHFLFVVALISGFWGIPDLKILIAIILLKLFFEYAFLNNVLGFYKKRYLSRLIPILTIIHPFYIVIMAIAGTFGTYHWKGRTF
ncbi:glycosyltransferase [Flexithrix dorotheae]|uniref:glycosyltransferase n=1 Tax=Flexithrix dorotheae TaxID=70993 RepID=UPI000363FD90|nr:glycosyltransferase [Flexithrix dorotheae]